MKRSPALADSPKIMFTGVVDDEGAATVKSLGGTLVDSVFECTHLVTDKVRRTVKFLCCLSRGCTIVDTSWLNRCQEENVFITPNDYVVRDRTAERQYRFSLQDSILLARSSRLLQGWHVHLTDNVKPPPSEMKQIVECAGGKVLVIFIFKYLFILY